MKYFVDIHNYTIILWTRADYQVHLVFGGFEGQEQSILVRLLKTTKFNLLLSIMDDGSLIGGGGGGRLFLLLKFIYSEKATKFCEIFPLLLYCGQK